MLAGLWGIIVSFSGPAWSRPDRRVALVIAISAGLVVGGFTELAAAAFMGFTTGSRPEYYVAALPFAFVAGGAVALASLAGYGLLARTRMGSAAVAGSLLGPVLFGGLAFGANLLGSEAGRIASQIEDSQHAAEIADRSSTIQLTVSDLQATTTADGSAVSSLSLRVTLRPAQAIALDTSLKFALPVFTAVPPGTAVDSVWAPTPPGAPTVLAAATDVVYDLTFEIPQEASGTLVPLPPGTWRLRVVFADTGGAEYSIEQDIVVAGG